MKDTSTAANQTTQENGTAKASATTDNKKGNEQQSGKTDQQASLLEKFLIDQLKDMYYAEQQIVKGLAKMEQACTTDELKEAFSDHQHQTGKHIKRLEKVFSIIGKPAEGKKCEAIEGILKEADNIISETKQGTMTRDAALIIAAQKVEHYEIATYGGLVQLAITAGLEEAADLLDKTLEEEEDTDMQLTDIAETYINIEAEDETNYSWAQQQQKQEAIPT